MSGRHASFVPIVALLLSNAGVAPIATQSQPPPPFTIVVSGPARAARCQSMAFMNGPNGGVYEGAKISPTPALILISTSFEGRLFNSMKAFIYCPGFAVTMLDVPSFAVVPLRTMTIAPAPLPSIRVTANVTFPPNAPPTGVLDVEVTHWADWVVEHFGTWDGAVPQFTRIAAVRLDATGTFIVDLPNFARDPLVSRFRNRGRFSFRTQTRDWMYNLIAGPRDTTPVMTMLEEIRLPDETAVTLALNAIPYR